MTEKGCWTCEDDHCAFQHNRDMGQECRFWLNSKISTQQELNHNVKKKSE